MTRSASGLPWYSFLYRLLGAQATFYLWLAAIIVLWWTTKPAVVRMANRSPAPLTVAKARTPTGLVRWVKLTGVELEIDRGMLQREEAAQSPPVRLLLAADDPAAEWWIETRRLCELASGPASDAKTTKARLKLIERRTELAGDGRRRALPAPERSILLQDLSLERTQLPLPRQKRTGGMEDFQKALEDWIANVLKRVRLGVTLEGVLDETPQTVATRVLKEIDVVPAPYMLQLDRRPRETESIVFGIAALVLLFLAVGLRGAAQSSTSEPEPEPAAPAPTAHEGEPA